ncbi:Small Conductance Mechanosensitive Ion Channel (MscS) Family, partial [Pseudoloma neurophilia]
NTNLNTNIDNADDKEKGGNLAKSSVFGSKISIKSDGNTLKIADFKRHFGKHDGIRIFALFDIDENNEVSKDEFKKRYKSLLKEKELLDEALTANDSSIKKLNILCSIILYPIMFIFMMFCLDIYSKVKGFFSMISAIVLSISFAFSSVASSVFQSIIFVFFVRPFDVGDVIEIDNKIFIVADLGILYSTFIIDSTYETIPNDKIRDKPIKNLRKSEYVTVNFQYQCSEKDFEKINQLEEKISIFLQENNIKYNEKFRIFDFCQLNNSEIKFDIQIIITCPYQEIITLEDRKDKFSLFLFYTTKELGMSLRRHK